MAVTCNYVCVWGLYLLMYRYTCAWLCIYPSMFYVTVIEETFTKTKQTLCQNRFAEVEFGANIKQLSFRCST